MGSSGAIGTYVRTPNASASELYLAPTGALAETMPRLRTRPVTSVLVTGTLRLMAIALPSGLTIGHIAMFSAGALATGSNQWFGLFDNNLARLVLTTDDGATAWGANSLKNLATTAPYTTTRDGLYYLGVCVVATGMPTLTGVDAGGSPGTLAPALWGDSSAGLTNPASCPATVAAIGVTSNPFYGYVAA
jgi:hypothetical protein